MFFLKSDFKSAIAIISFGLLMLCGCAGMESRQVKLVYAQNQEVGGWPDASLEKQFNKYWYDRFAGRVEESYMMETPYLREVVDPDKYRIYVMHASVNRLDHIEVQKIKHETDSLISIACVMQTTTIGSQKPVETVVIDRWLTMKGKWYHVIKDPILLSF